MKKICSTYGTHPNEYTRPVAQAVDGILSERGYEVLTEMVPFKKTAWGVALRGGSTQKIEKALGYSHIPESDFDYLFEFHATGFSLDELTMPAEEFGFVFIPHLVPGQNKAQGRGIIGCMPLMLNADDENPPPNAKYYSIEIPQISKPVSNRFLELIKERCKLFEDIDRPDVPDRTSLTYFRLMADRTATNKKCPPDVVAKLIVDGIEEYVLKM